MTADTSNQIAELRKAATCVYIAVEEGVAKDMSRIFSAAAQTIHDQSAALAERDRRYNVLVMAVMRGSHREARDLCRADFVALCPEEREHASKAQSDAQRAEAAEAALAEREREVAKLTGQLKAAAA